MTPLLTIQTIDPGVAALAATLLVAAIGLALAGWSGMTFNKPASRRASGSWQMRAGLATACAMAAFIITQWPVVTLWGGVAGWFIPTLRSSKTHRQQAVARVDAIADWIETVRGSVAGYAGLQQALKSSAEFAPAPIQAEVNALVARLQHNSTSSAVRHFAHDMSHPMADLVAACLMLTERNAAGNLPQVLSMTAQAARDNASLLRQVEAGRASTQSQGKLVALVTGCVSLLLVVFRRDFVSSYDSFTGQIALFIICSIFFVSGVAMYRLSKPAEVERVFGKVGAGNAPPSSETPERSDDQMETNPEQGEEDPCLPLL